MGVDGMIITSDYGIFLLKMVNDWWLMALFWGVPKMGIPQWLDGKKKHGKSPSINGWELEVPLWLWKPPYDGVYCDEWKNEWWLMVSHGCSWLLMIYAWKSWDFTTKTREITFMIWLRMWIWRDIPSGLTLRELEITICKKSKSQHFFS